MVNDGEKLINQMALLSHGGARFLGMIVCLNAPGVKAEWLLVNFSSSPCRRLRPVSVPRHLTAEPSD